MCSPLSWIRIPVLLGSISVFVQCHGSVGHLSRRPALDPIPYVIMAEKFAVRRGCLRDLQFSLVSLIP